MKTVGELKDGVAGLLQGTNLDNVTDLNGALERAARIMAQQADIPEASGRQSVTLYDGVFDYAAPTTIFGGALVDLRPQGMSRSSWDYVYKQPVELFDRTKHNLPNGYQVTFESRKGTGIMRVANVRAKGKAVLDRMQDTTNWTAAGSASGLTQDKTVFYESPSSLRFTLAGASTGTLTKAITQQDLSDYEDVGVGFLAIRTPSATDLTSVAVRVGSGASAYDEVSTTAGFLGAWTANDWLLLAFDFSGSTSTGTPDWSAIDYLQVRVTHAATLTNFYVGGFWLSLPSPHEVLFQSAAIFNEDGTLSNTITDDNTQIVLNDAAFTIYEYQSALTIAQQFSKSQANSTVQYLNDVLHNPSNGLYPRFQADNPSEEIRSVGNWY